MFKEKQECYFNSCPVGGAVDLPVSFWRQLPSDPLKISSTHSALNHIFQFSYPCFSIEIYILILMWVTGITHVDQWFRFNQVIITTLRCGGVSGGLRGADLVFQDMLMIWDQCPRALNSCKWAETEAMWPPSTHRESPPGGHTCLSDSHFHGFMWLRHTGSPGSLGNSYCAGSYSRGNRSVA